MEANKKQLEGYKKGGETRKAQLGHNGYTEMGRKSNVETFTKDNGVPKNSKGA